MPIKGLTDNQKPAFPRIGVLRKGAPKTSNAPGKDLQWFRFVTDDAEAMAAFNAAYPDNPDRIDVLLPFATTGENFEAWQEEWGAGSLKHRCDGDTCVVWQDKDGLYHTPGRCKCGETHEPLLCPGKCKPTGRLMVILPELRRLAYVQVLTTSIHDIMELTGNLEAAEHTAGMSGRDLRGIPFVLTRVPRMIPTPPRKPGGKRVRAEKWLLFIEPAPSWVALQIEAAQQMARPMITSPDDIPAPNGDEDDVIEGEPVELEPEKDYAEAIGADYDEPPPTNGDGDKVPMELSTEYWSKVKALQENGITIDGYEVLKEHGKNFTDALAHLEQIELA